MVRDRCGNRLLRVSKLKFHLDGMIDDVRQGHAYACLRVCSRWSALSRKRIYSTIRKEWNIQWMIDWEFKVPMDPLGNSGVNKKLKV